MEAIKLKDLLGGVEHTMMSRSDREFADYEQSRRAGKQVFENQYSYVEHDPNLGYRVMDKRELAKLLPKNGKN